MPPKISYPPDAVTQAGFEIVRERGFGVLSARVIADKLNSSTGPVYTAFASMDGVKAEVLRVAEELLMEYAGRPYTKSVFLNQGTGITLFALENPVLFRSMFIEATGTANIFEESIQKMARELDKDEIISLLPENEKADVVNKMAIFTYGYACLICTGVIKGVDKKTIIKTMLDMGRDVIDRALERCGKNPGS